MISAKQRAWLLFSVVAPKDCCKYQVSCIVIKPLNREQLHTFKGSLGHVQQVVNCRRHTMKFCKIHPRELQLERGRRLVHLRPVLVLQGISTRPPLVVRPDARRRRRQRICCARWGDSFRAQGSCLPHGTAQSPNIGGAQNKEGR